MCKMTLCVPSFALLARIHFWVTLDYLARCNLSHLTRFRHKRRHERGVGVSDSLLLRLMLLWPGLEELVLVDKAAEGVGQGGVEEALSDTGLLMLAAWASSLTTLTLSLSSLSASKRCSEVALMQVRVVESGVVRYVRSSKTCACTSLTHLDLSNFICMSDPPLHEFVSRCPSLAHLSLAGAPITDASLDLIPYLCPCCPPVYSVISPTPTGSAAPRSPISR
ncbi:unnamed protein product [Closterium sp. Naga37s-1]|nr:unnamed protein product [Closterium sp. Naga37s-1]